MPQMAGGAPGERGITPKAPPPRLHIGQVGVGRHILPSWSSLWTNPIDCQDLDQISLSTSFQSWPGKVGIFTSTSTSPDSDRAKA
jgi:hypothetical protein